MNNFVEAFKFIVRNGQIPGQPHLPTLVHLRARDAEGHRDRDGDLPGDRACRSGVWLGHLHRGSFVAINLGNIWRALPSLVVLAIGVAFLGHRAEATSLLALVVLAVPPIITNAYVGDRPGRPRSGRRGARDGHDGWQVLRRVELPLGDPAADGGDAHGRAVRRLDDDDRAR